MDRVHTVVIGAGVVGLAIGRALALQGREVLVLEAAESFGTETSARNSEVVHAGIYYPPGSLKARMCVAGRRMLYAYCAEHAVPVRNCGKFIVGTRPGHEAKLAGILERARANGVEDIDWIDVSDARKAEPALACTAALDSRTTGIVDSHAFMLALLGDLENAGGALATHAPVVRVMSDASGWIVHTGGTAAYTLGCDWLVNSAGLHAWTVAAAIEGFSPQHLPPRYLARGCYFSLSGRAPFSRLIYPVPVDGGLGVHLTLDMGGQAKFGPDVEWIDSIDYRVDPHRADSFYAEICEYWPRLPDGALQPSYAGIRPKLSGPGEPPADFAIQGPETHGVARLVNLFGIESPGLTSALAIGARVESIVRQD
jgi:L-2-hydroxyglutarate oxidase LhgO